MCTMLVQTRSVHQLLHQPITFCISLSKFSFTFSGVNNFHGKKRNSVKSRSISGNKPKSGKRNRNDGVERARYRTDDDVKVAFEEKKQNSKPFTTNNIKRFLKPKSDFLIDYSFTTSNLVADAIATAVVQGNSEGRRKIIELNPGLGLITNNLLSKGVKNLVIYDNHRLSTITGYDGKFEQLPINMISDDSFNTLLLEFFKYRDFKVRVIAVNPNRVFIRRIMQIILLRDPTFFSNVDFYFVLSEQVMNCLTLPSNAFSKTTDIGSFRLLMNLEVLQKFSPRDFLPPSRYKGKTMTYVRIKRKEKTIVSEEDFRLFWNFLNVIGSSKYNNLIGALEKWFPGCGPAFIARGLRVTTEVQQLTSDELIIIFKLLLTLKGYEEPLYFLRTYNEG